MNIKANEVTYLNHLFDLGIFFPLFCFVHSSFKGYETFISLFLVRSYQMKDKILKDVYFKDIVCKKFVKYFISSCCKPRK